MSLELKIKSKHLSEEARIIRFEEKKLKKQIRWMASRQALPPSFVDQYQSIHNHRVYDVRNENRATFLARAYLAGKTYASVEQKAHNKYLLKTAIYPRVRDMVFKYGPKKVMRVWNNNARQWEYPKGTPQEQELMDWFGL